MIPKVFIEQWRSEVPWQTLDMVEQDLIICASSYKRYSHVYRWNSFKHDTPW